MKPSIIIITGDQQRHRYFVNNLLKEFDVKLVIAEPVYKSEISGNTNDVEVLTKHFTDRDIAEREYFSGNMQFNTEKVIHVHKGESNSKTVFNMIKAEHPDYIVLYGSSIIHEPLLSAYKNKIINMHLGLSPYYRGSGTNFWPLVNREPELVGATIHLATLDIDGGDILKQVRPKISLYNGCHDIGCKTIIAGTYLMISCIKEYAANVLSLTPQQSKGKVYRRSDFSADAICRMLENFENGMIREYIDAFQERQLSFPIIE